MIQLVEAVSGVGRVELEVEGGGLDGLLFLTGELGEAIRECVGDSEVH